MSKAVLLKSTTQPDGECNACGFHKSLANPARGIRISGEFGKCTRPEGVCDGRAAAAPQRRRRTIDLAMPLSARERDRKAQLEGLIIGNFKAFYEVGCALREIRDEKLYRETHKRFDDYSKDLFDVARRRAYQLIDAADTVENVHNCAQKDFEITHHGGQIEWAPMNEAQARALVGLKPEEQARAWQEAVRTAKNGKITAAHVKRTRGRLYQNEISHAVARATQQRNLPVDPETTMSAEFEAAFDAFLLQVEKAMHDKWHSTSKVNVVRHLSALLGAITEKDVIIQDLRS
ncbi:MAG: hypothetical protein ABIL58_20120 [Pseudomonadota bacterium]